MKYAIFSDDFLSDFRLDDNGKTLVLTDKRGYTRAVKLLPYEERPHGEWKDGKCTNCGAECFEDYYMRDIKTEFCHRCGADMRGDKE